MILFNTLGSAQPADPPLLGAQFIGNNLMDVGDTIQVDGIDTQSLTWYESEHSSSFSKNIQSDPLFC